MTSWLRPPDVSLHGTPVGTAGGILNQYAHVQGMSRGSGNLLNKASNGNQTQKPVMQSTLGNPFPGDHDTFSSNDGYMPHGGFTTKQAFPMKNAFGQVSSQCGNTLQTNATLTDLNFRQEQVGNLETMQQNRTQLGSSQGLIPLDPLEQKILYNMDDSWDTSFCRSMDMGAASFGSAMEQSDNSSALQSGSWSALMQTAVAEASSCDTGVQEEWSGLAFRSTELDNHPPKFMDEEKQLPNWANGNLQNASNSKPFSMLNDSSMSSTFPGFQQSGFQSSNEHRESLHHYDFHKPFQKSPGNADEWSNYNPQQKSLNQTSQHIQPLTHLENTWAGQNYEHPESYMHGMALHNNVSQLCSEQKGDDVNGVMDKGRDLECYPWTGQMEQLHYRSDDAKREESQMNNSAAAPNLGTSEAHLHDQKATDQLGYMKHADFSMNNNENESGGETQHLPSSRNTTINSSYEEASAANKNFKASYNLKRLSGPQEGHVGHFMNLDQGPLSDFHGNSKASEHVVLGHDRRSSSSTVFGQTVESNDQGVTPHTSQQLLHKVDRSRENSPMVHFSTSQHSTLSEGSKVDAHDPYIAQMLIQSSASQGFGLKLASQSQQLSNSSCFLPQDSPRIASNANQSHVNPEVGVRNQGWLDSSSHVRILPPNELSQSAYMGEKSNSSGQTSVFSNLNMQILASDLPHVRSLQAQHMNAPVSGESSQATPTDTSRPFNLDSSQDTSQQASTDPIGQPFPSLENTSLSQPYIMPHLSPKSGMSARLQNTWKDVPASRLSSAAPSIDPSKNSLETTSLASQKGRSVSSDTGACYKNSQGSEYEEQPGEHRSNQQDPDRVLHGDNHSFAACERNLESCGRSLEASQTLHQNDTVLHQMQATKSSAETDPSKTAMRRYNAADSVTNVQQISDIRGPDLSRFNSSPSGDLKMQSLLTDSREELGGKALPRPVHQSLHGIGTLNQTQSQNLTKGVVYNHYDNPQLNLRMAPTWFKQFGTFRNGHMQPMHDAMLAKTAVEQFIPGKSHPHLPIHTDVDQRTAALPGQVGSVTPSITGSLVASENSSALHVLPSDLVERIRPVAAKKRKIIRSERIPWHKEVTLGSQRFQDISMAEQDWACTTNRLTEKIEDSFELIGEERPMRHRSKRRLIMTTQLTQQLLRPAPASVLLGDASSRYDGVTYLVARLALGDACCLTYDSTKGLHAAQVNTDLISEKLKAFESDKHFTKVEEDFTDRAKKLENDFLRLESASISDIRVEGHELERYSVINRFAKFHVRGQAGTPSPATVMNPPKSLPQKWVNVIPMPRNVPEEAQCLSL